MRVTSNKKKLGFEILRGGALSVLLTVAMLAVATVAWAAGSSTDLKDFITAVDVTGGTLNQDGSITVEPGTELTLGLSFEETSGLQFDNGSLTYDLPSGFDFAAQSGTFPMSITDGGGTTTMNVPYAISDGRLTVTWPTDDPTAYQKLVDAANAKFNISIKGTVTDANGDVHFGGDVTKKFNLDDSHDVSIAKSGYVGDDGKIHYTVTVHSTGVNKNVHVTDSISGTALTYDSDSLAISGISSSYTGGTSGNGFDITIPIMRNGETATITYTATIDYSKITDNGTAGQTGNKVTVETPDTPGKTESKDFANQISISTISKTGTAATSPTTSNGKTYRSVTWNIDANKERRVSLAGKSISDQIAPESQGIMRYSGAGIRIDVYDESGSFKETRTLTWAQLGVGDLSSATSWRYDVPSTDGKYEYKVSYTTDVDITDTLQSQTVKNNATEVTPNGDKSTDGQATVNPAFNVDVKKKATKVSGTEVTWQFHVTVPKDGYTKLEATDILPNTYLNGQTVYDSLVDGSIQVDGLASGESYSVDASETGKVRFVFYKDAAKTQPGAIGTGSERTITVTLKTRFNEDWINAVNNGTAQDYQKTHTNNVRVTANDVSKDASASVNPGLSHGITKGGDQSGTRHVGEWDSGIDLPVYRYEVVLTGVSSDSFTITDSFDTSILEYYASDAYDAAHIYGGTQYGQYDGNVTFTTTPTSTGMTINVSSLPKTSSGSYYSHYKLVYYLTVKDADALKALRQRATDNNGKTTIDNTVNWDGNEGKRSIDYSYDFLGKNLTKWPNPSSNDRTASYTITLNPAGTDINPDGDTLTLKDTMTNQVLDVSSIKATPSEGVTYDYDVATKTLTVTFPDATPVTLTYNATVIGTGNVQYSNTASLSGQSKTTTQTGNFSSSGSGSASIPSIKLLKYAKGDLTKKLEGATFALYNADANGDIDRNNPVRDKDGSNVTFTSNSQGIVDIKGGQTTVGWTIEEGKTYYLVETQSPDGYKLDPTPIKFTVTDSPTEDDQYISGFTLQVANEEGSNGFVLPDTGGTGTVLSRMASLVLLAGAAFGLRRLRRGM